MSLLRDSRSAEVLTEMEKDAFIGTALRAVGKYAPKLWSAGKSAFKGAKGLAGKAFSAFGAAGDVDKLRQGAQQGIQQVRTGVKP